jgi:G:T-mismatch repair DNA endonuclease (very short patch repair protein)
VKNRQYWREKIDRNRQRAVEVKAELRAAGFNVFRIWEHEIGLGKSRNSMRRLLDILNRPSIAPARRKNQVLAEVR